MVISGTIYICIIFATIYLNSQKKKKIFLLTLMYVDF